MEGMRQLYGTAHALLLETKGIIAVVSAQAKVKKRGRPQKEVDQKRERARVKFNIFDHNKLGQPENSVLQVPLYMLAIVTEGAVTGLSGGVFFSFHNGTYSLLPIAGVIQIP